MEWINPEYADIVTHMHKVDDERRKDDPEAPPVRGFLLPEVADGH